MEALELGIHDLGLMKAYYAAKESTPNIAMPPRNALYIALGGISAEKHVLDVVKKIKAANLQDALLVLPFDKAVDMLTFLDIWAERVCLLSVECMRLIADTDLGMEYPPHLSCPLLSPQNTPQADRSKQDDEEHAGQCAWSLAGSAETPEG